MLIKRVSQMSGNTYERDIDVTQEQLDKWESGTLIQFAMPDLSDDDREFIMTGITPEEWGAAFPDEDDDESYEFDDESPF